MKKKLFVFVLCLVLFGLSYGQVSASDNELEVEQRIDILDANQVIFTYVLRISNNSKTDLIYEAEISFPYEDFEIVYFTNIDDAQKKRNLVELDFFDSPINVGAEREIILRIKVHRTIDTWYGLKRFSIRKFEAQLPISKYRLVLNYPQSWEDLRYSSKMLDRNELGVLITEKNQNFDFVWGKVSDINATYEFDIEQGGDDALIPLIGSSRFQKAYIKNFDLVEEVLFDRSGNIYAVVLEGNKKEFSVSADLYFREREKENETDYLQEYDYEFSKIEGESSLARVQGVLENLSNDFELTKRVDLDKSFEQMQGDPYNLVFITLGWFRSEKVESYISVGWDFSTATQDSAYRYWVNWKSEDGWQRINPLKFVSRQTNNYEEVSPEKITLLDITEISDDSFQGYANLLKNEFYPALSPASKENDTQESANVRVIWDEDSSGFNLIKGKINVENNSNEILVIENFVVNGKTVQLSPHYKDYKIGVLPGNYKVFEIEYARDLKEVFQSVQNLDYTLSYSIDSTQESYNNQESIKNLQIDLRDLEASVFLGIFMFVVLLSSIAKKVRYRPRIKFRVEWFKKY